MTITANKCIYLYPSAKYFLKIVKIPSAQHIFKNEGPKILKKNFFLNLDTRNNFILVFAFNTIFLRVGYNFLRTRLLLYIIS